MVAKFEDQNHKLSVDVELTARVTGPAGRLDSAEATRIALYRVFGNVGEANDPIDDPTAGRLLQVSVGWTTYSGRAKPCASRPHQRRFQYWSSPKGSHRPRWFPPA